MESIASAGNNSNNNNNNNNNNHRNKYHDDREQDYRDENVNVNYLNANKSSSKGNERRNQRHGNLKKEYTNTKNVENQEQQNSNHAHAFAFSNRSSSNKSNEQQRNTNTNNHNGKQRNNTRKKKKGKKPVQHHVRVSNDPIIYNVKSHTSENDHHYNYDDTIPTEVEVARKIIQTGHLSPAPSSVTTHTRCSRASSPESNVTTNAAGAALLNRLNVTTNVGTCNTNRNMNTNACKQHYKAAAAAVLSQSQSSSGYDDVGMLQFVSQQHQPRASADADAGIVITGESSNNTSATAFLRPQPIMYSSAGVQTQTQVYTHNFEAHIPTIPALAPAGVEGYAYSHPAAAASTAGSNNVAFSTVPSGNSSIVSTSGAMMRAAVYAPDFVPIHYEYAAPNGTVFYAQAAPLHPPQPQSFYVPVARHPYGGGDESTTGQHSQNLNPSAQEWVPPGAGAK